MLTKTQVLKSIEALPEEFSVDELIERILLLNELKNAIAQSDNGEGRDMDDVFNDLLSKDEKES